jgi:8-oxo-dGTP diphosphatase
VTKRPSKKTAVEPPKVDADELAFLATYDASVYARPSVAIDVAVITASDGALRTLVVKRAEHPSKGRWALPGGFLAMDESLDQAASRVLSQKARLENIYLEQLYTFGAVARDPRTRVISVGYFALVNAARFEQAVQSKQNDSLVATVFVPWEGELGGIVELLDQQGKKLPTAFDHAEMLGLAVKRMRGKLDYAPIGFQLLGDTFTLLELQKVHETVLGRAQNKDSFRRRMLNSGLLEATGKLQDDVEHRPAELYRFVRRSAV